jgi:hypothetical protein
LLIRRSRVTYHSHRKPRLEARPSSEGEQAGGEGEQTGDRWAGEGEHIGRWARARQAGWWARVRVSRLAGESKQVGKSKGKGEVKGRG